MPDSVIECRGCTVNYGSLTVLEDLNLTVRARETLCIVGPNGGGKSTLLKLILGLVQPLAGSIRVMGELPRKVRQRIGYMPQAVGFDALFPITVEGIVLMGRLQRSGLGIYSAKDRKAAQRALDEVGMLEHRSESFARLSGGMKQRVLIARAMVGEPEILLLDEPTAMVDAEGEARLLDRLKAIHERLTLIIVSHDAAFVSGLVDEVLCVNRHAEMHPLEPVKDAAIERVYGKGAQAVLHHHGHRPRTAENGARCSHD